MFRKKRFVRKKANKILLSIFIYLIFIIIFYYFLGVSFGQFAAFVLLGMGIVLLTEEIMDFIFPKRVKEYRHKNKGAKGEETLDDFLLKNKEGFEHIPDVKLNEKGNIDHIIITKNGIFSVETKKWSGKWVCYGDDWYKIEKNKKIWDFNQNELFDKRPGKQAKYMANELQKFLKEKFSNFDDIWVQAVVVFLDIESDLYILKNPENCKIVRNPEELLLYIKNDNRFKKEIFSEEEIKKIKSSSATYR